MTKGWNTYPSDNDCTVDDFPHSTGDTITYDGAEWEITEIRTWNQTLVISGPSLEIVDWNDVLDGGE